MSVSRTFYLTLIIIISKILNIMCSHRRNVCVCLRALPPRPDRAVVCCVGGIIWVGKDEGERVRERVSVSGERGREGSGERVRSDAERMSRRD